MQKTNKCRDRPRQKSADKFARQQYKFSIQWVSSSQGCMDNEVKNVSTSRTTHQKKHLRMEGASSGGLPGSGQATPRCFRGRNALGSPKSPGLVSSVSEIFSKSSKANFNLEGRFFLFFFLICGSRSLQYDIDFLKGDSRLSGSTNKHQKARSKEPAHRHVRSGSL